MTGKVNMQGEYETQHVVVEFVPDGMSRVDLVDFWAQDSLPPRGGQK
jgi:hypothetical protein